MYYFKETFNYELSNGLMEDNKDLNQKIVTDSHKREDMIVQILKDNLDLEINHDSNFINGRELRFIQFKLYEKEKKEEEGQKEEKEDEIIEGFRQIYKKLVLNKDANNFILEIPDDIEKELKFHCKVGETKVDINQINNDGDKKMDNTLSAISSSNKNSCLFENEKSDSITRAYSVHDEKFFPLNLQYNLKNKNFTKKDITLTIIRKRHEFDGNLIAKNDINNLKDIIGDIIYYPKNGSIKIDKGQTILIKVKQNDTIKSLFEQIKRKIMNLKELFPEKSFIIFGFLNENNYKVNMQDETEEKNFIKNIDTFLSKYFNFKIIFTLINSQKFLDINLDDQVDYSTHYYYKLNQKFDKKINEIGEDITNMRNDITNMKNDITNMKKEMKNDITNMKNDISGLKDEMKALGTKLDTIFKMIQNLNLEAKKPVDEKK